MGAHHPEVDRDRLALFAQRLTALDTTTLPLRRDLTMVNRRDDGGQLNSILGRMHDTVLRKRPLSSTLRRFPALFSSLCHALMGTNRGDKLLTPILRGLTSCGRGQRGVHDGLVRSLVCPYVLAAITVKIIVVLLATIIPGVARRFIRVGRRLPLDAHVLLNLDSALRHANPALLTAIFVITMNF